jgi:hypothetical protein
MVLALCNVLGTDKRGIIGNWLTTKTATWPSTVAGPV